MWKNSEDQCGMPRYELIGVNRCGLVPALFVTGSNTASYLFADLREFTWTAMDAMYSTEHR